MWLWRTRANQNTVNAFIVRRPCAIAWNGRRASSSSVAVRGRCAIRATRRTGVISSPAGCPGLGRPTGRTARCNRRRPWSFPVPRGIRTMTLLLRLRLALICGPACKKQLRPYAKPGSLGNRVFFVRLADVAGLLFPANSALAGARSEWMGSRSKEDRGTHRC
jgi:hypothetical protein